MKKIIWTNGCFDVIHKGHIELFKHAKSLGDYLVVGVDTDQRVAALKGADRPLHKLEDRILVLNAIEYVDKVVSFSSDFELEELVAIFSPFHLVVGSDYKNKKVIGAEHAENLTFFNKLEGYSTTNILEKWNKPSKN